MGIIKTFNDVWSGLRTLANRPEDGVNKSWDDVLLAVRNGNLEEWEAEGGVSDPYKENYVINRALNLLAQNVAQVPLDVYLADKKQKEHQFLSVLKRPNPYTSRFELWEQTMIYFFLYGEAFWYLNTNQYGIIKEIYALHPKYVKHVREKENSGNIKGWIWNDQIPMSLDEVIHFKLFNNSGIRGLSPLEAVKYEYQADKEAAKYNRQFFNNGTRVSGVIRADKDVQATLEDMNRVLASWKANHQGANNAYKVGALTPGLTYEELGQTMRDMEYIAGRDAIRDRILLVLGIHKSIVGITDKIDRSTADVALRSLWQTTLKPQVIRIQEKLNAELFDLYYPNYSCKFDLTVIEELKKDLKASTEVAKNLHTLGYTRDEINERLGLGMPDETDGGEYRYRPMNMIPDETMPSYVSEEPVDINADKKDFTKNKAEKQQISKEKRRFRDNFIQRQSDQERIFYKKIKGFFFKQRKKVLKSLPNGKDAFDEAKKTELILRIQDTLDGQDKLLEELIIPLYQSAGEAGVRYAYDALGLDKVPEIAPEVLTRRANMLTGVDGVNQTIFNQIKMAINEGVDAGETLPEITTRIKQVYNKAADRASTIARTETASMMSESALRSYREEGVRKKLWITVGDKNVREQHANNESQGAIPVNQAFQNGEQYPGHNSVNCRCALAPEVE